MRTIALLGQDAAILSVLKEPMRALGLTVLEELGPAVEAVVMVGSHPSSLVERVTSFDQTLPIIILDRLPVRIFALIQEVENRIVRNGKRVGPWQFFAQIRLLKGSDDQTEYLTPKECEMLEYLIAAQGLVTRDDLLADVFGYSIQVSSHTVETHMHTLRKKLGADLVITEDAGYRLEI
jgi:DNA-binding response OmpR family regulator